MWPIVKLELKRPWERHTSNTIHLLLAIYEKYPHLIDSGYLEASIKTSNILTPLAHKHLGRIYWGSTSLAAITHPSYDALATFLQSVKSKQLLEFWNGEVNETLAASNKIKEVVTLRLMTEFCNQGIIKPNTMIALLTPRFIKMIVNSLKNLRQQKHDVLQTFYDEFFSALNVYFTKVAPPDSEDDTHRVEIIKKFLLHPGQLLIEKYLPQNAVHQLITKLNKGGISQMFALYKDILLGKLPKNASDPTNNTWLNIEKQQCAQMMQYLIGQKTMQHDIEWRSEQLQFLLNVSLFYSSNDGTPVRRDQDSGFVTKELSQTMKNMFYSSLQTKMSNLKDEKNLLRSLVKYCNSIMSKKGADKYLRTPLSDSAKMAWEQMYAIVFAEKHTQKIEKNLKSMFHILCLHMGLQLFREADMAQLAIADLAKCMDKTTKRSDNNKTDEPEWIEVVTDLFLHLLSQNASFLRNIVNNVFPHVCPNMTLSAIHQILSMIDMKDGKNPLSSKKENDEEDEDAEMPSESEEEEMDEEDDDEVDEKMEDDDDEEEGDDVIEEDEGNLNYFIFN